MFSRQRGEGIPSPTWSFLPLPGSLQPSPAERQLRHSFLHLTRFLGCWALRLHRPSKGTPQSPRDQTLCPERESSAATTGLLYGETAKATTCHGLPKPRWARGWLKNPLQSVQVHRTPERTTPPCGSSRGCRQGQLRPRRCRRKPPRGHDGGGLNEHLEPQCGHTMLPRTRRGTCISGLPWWPTSLLFALKHTSGEKLAVSNAGLALPPAAQGKPRHPCS